VEEAVAQKRSGLGYGGVKIFEEMHRKRKSALIFSFFWIKPKGLKITSFMLIKNTFTKQVIPVN